MKRNRPDSARRTVFGMLLLPVAICWTLYGYYFFAQHLDNPMPVTAQFLIAECWTYTSSGRTRGTAGAEPVEHEEFYLKTEYEFDSRSKSFLENGRQRVVKDRITDYTKVGRFEACEVAAKTANDQRKPTTVWAGEDDIDDRFRARMTERREYPAFGLLWVPALVAGLGIWLWTRAVRRQSRSA